MIAEPARMLSEEERTLLEWLIKSATKQGPDYACQVDNARVVGQCECGCGSIDFDDGLPFEGGPRMEIIADHSGHTPECRLVTVLLWVRNGLLSYLEIVIYDDLGPCPTPRPSWFERIAQSIE